jgi:hypothetical protein
MLLVRILAMVLLVGILAMVVVGWFELLLVGILDVLFLLGYLL